MLKKIKNKIVEKFEKKIKEDKQKPHLFGIVKDLFKKSWGSTKKRIIKRIK